MPRRFNDVALHHLRRLIAGPTGDSLSDGQLLERFVRDGDETAFAAVLRRHGAMVLQVAQRVLHDWQAAEDVFQAAFLVLARKAASIRKGDALSSWLHGVAHRLALNARHAARSRPAPPPRAAAGDPGADLTVRELRLVLDEELTRLPRRLRAPLVLCYLEGKTRDEAAQLLSWSLSAVKRRLERGREALRGRLVRRGLDLPVALTPILLLGSAPEAPAALLTSTLQAALAFAAGRPPAAPESVVALANGMLGTLGAPKLAAVGAVLLALGLLGAAGSAWLGTPPEAPPSAAAPPAAAPPVPARPRPVDAFGDPLPEHARGRLGTARWWYEGGVAALEYAADGKTLFVAAGDRVHLLEASTGRELRVLPLTAAAAGAALAPDGSLLATVAADNRITLWELPAGKERRRWQAPLPELHAVTFAPDGRALFAGSKTGCVLQFDLDGRLTRSFGKPGDKLANQFRYHGGVAARDGVVAVGTWLKDQGVCAKAVVKRWDLATGKELPDLMSKDGALMFTMSPDKKIVAWHEPNASRLVDLKTGETIRTLPGAVQFFSADSASAVAAVNDYSEPVKFAAWDVRTGKELRQFAALPQGAGIPGVGALSPDGSRLAWALQFMRSPHSVVYHWDGVTGRQLPLRAGHRTEVLRAALAPDGSRVVTVGADNQVLAWDAAGGKPTRETALPPGVRHARFSADGRTLLASFDGGVLRSYDADLQLVKSWQGHPANASVEGLALSADGARAASRCWDRTIRIWEPATGKELHRIDDRESYPNERSQDYHLDLVFSPDGRTLAVMPPSDAIRLYDVATGGKVKVFAPTKAAVTACAYAPDGRTIATADDRNEVVLWEVATGREFFRFSSGAAAPLTVLAWTPDGKHLLGAGSRGGSDPLSRDRSFRVWEAATGEERLRRTGHLAPITSAALTADGRTLVTGSEDTSMLIWELPALQRSRPAAQAFGPGEAERLWRDLAGADAGKARRSMERMCGAPGETVALLREKLAPLAPPDEQTVNRLLGGLRSEAFADRQRAADELARFGVLVEPALKQALAGNPSLDLKQWLDRLLEQLNGSLGEPDHCRIWRALAVLEEINSAQARRLLEQLAEGKGAERCRQLRLDARAALARLAERQPDPS